MDKGIYTGEIVSSTIPTLEEQIRKIVREEIAAHQERLEVISPATALSWVSNETLTKAYYGVKVESQSRDSGT